MILLFVLVFLPSYYDISHYVKRDFKYAVGQLEAVSQAKTTKGFGLWEEIRIQNTTYISPVSITTVELDAMVMIEYLPHSRFIMQYWSKQSAPEH
ncbi:hypothetical protein PA598K_00085 [Paenibacillus sp. 598K]|nr:hypothetical protein PA598K_00085 [Paenibacillus sp. 598K]